jgi:hypothetical protein
MMDSFNLKILKVMPKYGSKTLNISICGGNITMMMNKFIICMQLSDHAGRMDIKAGLMQDQ